jgi:hypothetical protein
MDSAKLHVLVGSSGVREDGEGPTSFFRRHLYSRSLEERMALLASDSVLRVSMGQCSFERIRPRTIDWWARG